mmetsp:Transcript_22625/g.63554  ORF Transcript_22625/g.63554 Transcript_22625/m.63554 type:complete len:443 (+) Transcript_22625:429-1757(+)
MHTHKDENVFDFDIFHLLQFDEHRHGVGFVQFVERRQGLGLVARNRRAEADVAAAAKVGVRGFFAPPRKRHELPVVEPALLVRVVVNVQLPRTVPFPTRGKREVIKGSFLDHGLVRVVGHADKLFFAFAGSPQHGQSFARCDRLLLARAPLRVKTKGCLFHLLLLLLAGGANVDDLVLLLLLTTSYATLVLPQLHHKLTVGCGNLAEERVAAGTDAVLIHEKLAQSLRRADDLRFVAELNRFLELLVRNFRVEDGVRADALSRHHVAPERLVAKERDDNGWEADAETGRHRTGTTVVAAAGAQREEPVVRHRFVQKKDVLAGLQALAQPRPALVHNGAYGLAVRRARVLNRLDDELGELLGIFHHDRSEANVEGLWSGLQEIHQRGNLFARVEAARQVQKPETDNVNVWAPVRGLCRQVGRHAVRLRYTKLFDDDQSVYNRR